MATNPGFEADEPSQKWKIPRVGLNANPSFRTPDAERGNGAAPDSYGKSYDELQMTQSLGGSKGNYTVNQPPQDEKEDYSLYSILKDVQCLKPIINVFSSSCKNVEGLSSKLLKSAFVVLAVAYFIVALIIPSKQIREANEYNYWCHDDGFLIIIYSIVLIFVCYFKVLKPLVSKRVSQMFKTFKEEVFVKKMRTLLLLWYVKLILYVIVIIAVVIFLIIDSRGERSRLVSLLGIFLLLLFGFIFSVAPRKIIWRQVLWGLGLQFLMGLMILRWSVGRETFNCLGEKVQAFLGYTDKGSTFVYGKLVSELHIFAFKVLTVILFFSFCINILYYYGAMQWMVIKLGWLLQVTVGTTACESVNAAANIFLGQSEAPLLIKPFLPLMTKSELHAVMTGGFSTIAGSVLAAYISFGVDPAHLLTASVMSAPAALGFSKLFYPEVEESKTHAKDIKITKGTETNVLHAACEGVTSAIPLVANVAANLLAFIAFIAFVDALFNWSCVLVGVENDVCTLSNAFGYIFMPLAYIMGVPWKDCYYVGQLIGTKTIVNEFVGYRNLVTYVEEDKISKRSEIIATYALCGFSNIAGIGIQLGSLGAMAPERRGDLAKVALRAMIAGSVACFLTACVAGCLISVEEYVSSESVAAAPLQ